METLWPWLAVAGLGALHGLSPANGWMFAAERGLRSRDEAQALRALVPMALGHATSVGLVVTAVAQGVLVDRARVQGLAGALLVGVAAWRWMRGGRRLAAARNARTSHAGIAIWSCLMATAHGAGLMLVPALVPLCMSDSPAREITASGSVVLAIAAVGVHVAAMLATTGAIAGGICRGVARHPGLLHGAALRHAWNAALAITGVALVVLR
ncbi:MAG TPA: hypothetical protein VIT90_11920 [Lysobacter sp.]